MSERLHSLQLVRIQEPNVRYWRIGASDFDSEIAADAIEHGGFVCIEQSMSSGRYRLLGTQEAADKWPELYKFFEKAPEIVAPDPEAEDLIHRRLYTMEYSAGNYSQPGVQPSEAEMMTALHSLFDDK